MQFLPVQYSSSMVLMSIAISMIAAYAASSLAERMRRAGQTPVRKLWLLGGSCALGIGIWSMHYLGMLALQLPVTVSYFLPTVLLSLLLAIGASGIVLVVVSGEHLGWKRLLSAGALMGAGIGGMHYTGMSAMRSTAMHHYEPGVVALSLAVAWGFSTIALWIGFAVGSRPLQTEWMRIAGSIVMGLGIAAMHYTAMAGMHYSADGMAMPRSAWLMQRTTLGGTAVAVTTIFILLVALGTAALDKRRFRQLEESQDRLLAAQDELVAKQQELVESRQQLIETNALLSELSIRDGLTGLHNRRHFDMVLDTEWRRAARVGDSIAALMIDVDCFKSLNDRYGHQRGDDALRELARVSEDQPRRGHDLVARYGGEEFSLLLPGATLGPP